MKINKKIIYEMGFIGILRYIYRHFYVNIIKNTLITWYIKMLGAKIGKNVTFTVKPYVSNSSGLVVGDNCIIGAEILSTTGEGKIIIGKNTHIISGIIQARTSVIIGDNVHISGGCFIVDSNHNKEHKKQTVIIGDNTWMAYGVTMVPDSSVGNNCIVAAEAVVTKNFPDNVMIAGNPAIIKQRVLN